jgi:regulatory protein
MDDAQKEPVDEGELEVVREKALELLALREHSRKELMEKLLRRKFPRDLADRVGRDLAACGLLDDARFARNLVRSRLRSRPCGERGLVSLLRTKGIAPEDAKDAVREVMGEEEVDEEEMARKLLHARLGGKKPDEKALARAGNLLLRRGFDARVVRKIIREYGHPDMPVELEEESEDLRDQE